jgi:phytoene dehydrogenase-like protein
MFRGVDARISAYSYLVSLFPHQIIQDLGLRFETRRRSIAAFTPTIRNGQQNALLISNVDPAETEDSFVRLTGNHYEYEAYRDFYASASLFAERVWPSLLEPLITRQEMARRFDSPEARAAWEMIVEQPLGESVERLFQDDLVRGTVFTDSKIGVLTHPHDPSLLQNRTFLYHVIGNLTGEWRVPVGGMGAVTGELERCARSAGAQIVTSATVRQITPTPDPSVEFVHDDRVYTVGAKYILGNVTPDVLSRLIPGRDSLAPHAEGSVFKINMLLKRLPRLKTEGYSPEQAFTGTFHIDEGYAAMQASYQSAARGEIPANPPGEMYCHSLTDRSILGPDLDGYQTLTLFGLDMPCRLFRSDKNGNAAVKQEMLTRYLRAINRYLAEPIEGCLAEDGNHQPCIEAKSTVDLENELNMSGGHIFHTDLSWPFVEQPEARGTWGVETADPTIFLCGSGAMRGGCVSGIPGHNAAMKVLECLGRTK